MEVVGPGAKEHRTRDDRARRAARYARTRQHHWLRLDPAGPLPDGSLGPDGPQTATSGDLFRSGTCMLSGWAPRKFGTSLRYGSTGSPSLPLAGGTG